MVTPPPFLTEVISRIGHALNMLHWRKTIQCHIRAFVIIKLLPPRGIVLQFVQR